MVWQPVLSSLPDRLQAWIFLMKESMAEKYPNRPDDDTILEPLNRYYDGFPKSPKRISGFLNRISMLLSLEFSAPFIRGFAAGAPRADIRCAAAESMV